MKKKSMRTFGGLTIFAECEDDQYFFDDLPRANQIEYLHDKYPMLDVSKGDIEVKELCKKWDETKQKKWSKVIESQFEVRQLPYSSEKIEAAIKILSGYPTIERIEAAVKEFLEIDARRLQAVKELIESSGEIHNLKQTKKE